jgi:hypothetical protein
MANSNGPCSQEHKNKNQSKRNRSLNSNTMASDQNDTMANQTQQPSSSAPKLSPAAAEFSSSMASMPGDQEFQFCANVSNFTPSFHSDNPSSRNGVLVAASQGFNVQREIPTASVQGKSYKKGPRSYFQSMEYHGQISEEKGVQRDVTVASGSNKTFRNTAEVNAYYRIEEKYRGDLKGKGKARADDFQVTLSQPPPSQPVFPQPLPPQAVLSLLPPQAVLSQPPPSQPAWDGGGWPLSFHQDETFLPLPPRPQPSEADLQHQIFYPLQNYFEPLQSGPADESNDDNRMDTAENNRLPDRANQDNLVPTQILDDINGVIRTGGVLETPDQVVARVGLSLPPGPPPANTPSYHLAQYHREPHKDALTSIFNYAIKDIENRESRMENIEQWWEHALVVEVDRLREQLKDYDETSADLDDHKKQLSAAQDELGMLKETELGKAVERLKELEAEKEKMEKYNEQLRNRAMGDQARAHELEFRDLGRMKRQNNNLHVKVNLLRGMCDFTWETRQRVERDKPSAKQMIDDMLADEVSSLREEIGKLKINAQITQNRLDDAEEQVSELRSQDREVRDLERQLREATEEAEELRQENEELHRKNDNLPEDQQQLQDFAFDCMKKRDEAIKARDKAEKEMAEVLTQVANARTGRLAPDSEDNMTLLGTSERKEAEERRALPSESIAPARQYAASEPAFSRSELTKSAGREEYM